MIKIERRPKIDPVDGKKKYDDVEFADEKNKKYPLDSRRHVEASLHFFAIPNNYRSYSVKYREEIHGKLEDSAKRFGIDISGKEKSFEFAFTTRTLKAYTEDKKMMFEGEASGTEIYLDEERMNRPN